jgi:hypothetical protein
VFLKGYCVLGVLNNGRTGAFYLVDAASGAVEDPIVRFTFFELNTRLRVVLSSQQKSVELGLIVEDD